MGGPTQGTKKNTLGRGMSWKLESICMIFVLSQGQIVKTLVLNFRLQFFSTSGVFLSLGNYCLSVN